MLKRLLIFLGVVGLALLVNAAPVQSSPRGDALILHNGKVSHAGEAVSYAMTASPRVWDGTPSTSNWQIDEAVREWNKRSAFEATMTTNSSADVRVTEIYDSCGYTGMGVVLGCAYSDGTIHLNPSYATQPLAEHVGGHELGHVFGHPHVTGVRSWMQPSVDASNWLRAPTSYDISVQQQLYGR